MGNRISRSTRNRIGAIKVAALTRGTDIPSSRFRIRQYRETLAKQGITLQEHCPFISQMVRLPGFLGRLRRRQLFPWLIIQTIINILLRIPAFIGSHCSTATLINRSVVPGLEETVFFLRRPRILDVDDAIWLTDPRGISASVRLAKRVDAVIAGNDYLAAWYRQYNDNVFVLPTAVDTEKYVPKDELRQTPDSWCTIGWIGTDGNFEHLEIAKNALIDIIKTRPNCRVLIVSNRRPDGWNFDEVRFIFRYWSEETEIRDLQDMDIGIMPLIDNEWTRGKCSFKMLQYLAVGIPVVVSTVGMNNEVLRGGDIGYGASNEEDWQNAISLLCDDEDSRKQKGAHGRVLVESSYSVNAVGANLSSILLELTHND